MDRVCGLREADINSAASLTSVTTKSAPAASRRGTSAMECAYPMAMTRGEGAASRLPRLHACRQRDGDQEHALGDNCFGRRENALHGRRDRGRAPARLDGKETRRIDPDSVQRGQRASVLVVATKGDRHTRQALQQGARPRMDRAARPQRASSSSMTAHRRAASWAPASASRAPSSAQADSMPATRSSPSIAMPAGARMASSSRRTRAVSKWRSTRTPSSPKSRRQPARS